MFNKEFFKRKQKLLLWLLNTSLIRLWFRWILRIDYKGKINQITPNSFTYSGKLKLKDGKLVAEMTTDFRTHNKYSKRLYYAFLPLWKLCHYWDILIANKLSPALNLGFDTTFYPQAGTGGSNVSCDGWCWQNQEAQTWGTLVGAVGTNAYDTAATLIIQYKSNAGGVGWDNLTRIIFTIDTSNIGSGTITAATLSLYGTAKVNDLGNSPTINIYASAPAANNALAAGDYDSLGTTAFCDTAITYAGWNTAGYNAFALNASGLTAIAKTGITKMGARNPEYDVANSAPPDGGPLGSTDSLTASSADETGTAQDPKLVVTWSVPVNPSNATMTLSGQVPTITATITVSPTNATMTLSGQVPTITISGGWSYPAKHGVSGDWTFTPKS